MDQAVPWGGNRRNFFEPVPTSSRTNKPIPLGPDGRPIHPLRMHPVNSEPEGESAKPATPAIPPTPRIMVTEPSSSTISHLDLAAEEDSPEEFYDVWPDRRCQRRKEKQLMYHDVGPDRSYQDDKGKEVEYPDVWPDRTCWRRKQELELRNAWPDQSYQTDKGKEVESPDVWPERTYQRRKHELELHNAWSNRSHHDSNGNEVEYPDVWPDRTCWRRKQKELELRNAWPDQSYQRSKGKEVAHHDMSPGRTYQHNNEEEVEDIDAWPDRSSQRNKGKEVEYGHVWPDRTYQRNKGKEVEHHEPIVTEGKDKSSKRTRFYAEAPESEMASRYVTAPSEPVENSNDKVNPPAHPVVHTNTNASARSTQSSLFKRYFSKKEQPLATTPSAPAHFNINYSVEDTRSMKKRLKKREAAAWRAQGFDDGYRPMSMKRIARAICPWKKSNTD